MAYSSSTQLVLHWFPYKDLVGKCSKNYGIQQSLMFDKRKRAHLSPRILYQDEMFSCKTSHHHKLHNFYKVLRSVIVRSEIVGNGSTSAAYHLSELQLISKVRGVCFYSVTSIIALFLFVLMVISHPFVVLRDGYQRNFHHLIAKIWAPNFKKMLVKNGGSVFFFPEGTRSKDGRLGTFKKGAFSIAAKTGVPVVPTSNHSCWNWENNASWHGDYIKPWISENYHPSIYTRR